MGSYSVGVSKHAVLAANVVDTVTLGRDYITIEVVNRDGVAEIYVTTDGTTPTVGGDNTYVLPAAIGGMTVPTPDISGSNVVKLKSAGTPAYSVIGS